MGSALFTCDDIKLAQRLIRPCLSQYMEREEVMEKLYAQEKIPAGLTELAWKKLEEQYPEFFKAYYLRVTLKQQIITFNRLLAEHAELTRQQQQQHAAVSSSPPNVNGSRDHAAASSPSPSSCCAALQGTATVGNANTPHFAPNPSAPNGNNNSGIMMESYSNTANGYSGGGGGGQLCDDPVVMENMSLDEIWELFN